jgi:hypothetical protein
VNRFLASLLAILLLVGSGCSLFSSPDGGVEGTQAAKRPRGKVKPIHRKMIEFGFDLPSAEFISTNIAEMEKRPFDGIVFRPGAAGVRWRAFDSRSWSADELGLDTLRSIRWDSFTDNFLHLYTASYSNMDWFDDDHWQTITDNMRIYRKAVDACDCVGVAIDPEYYGGRNPWAYASSEYSNMSFGEVQTQVRKRGAQFITALQPPGEDLTILFFFLLGYVRADIARGIALEDSRYALLPAFLDGILDAAQPGLNIVDGNEDAYHYKSTNQFFDAPADIRAAAELVSSNNQERYQNHVQVGSSLFVDQVLLRGPESNRQMLWDHNVYNALATSETYVWCYSQDQDWWNGKLIPGSETGISRALTRLQALRPLGYDLASATSLHSSPSVALSMRATRNSGLLANVTGSDIVRVDFYQSGELIASDERFPFAIDTKSISKGFATFVARAFDARGAHGTSAPAGIRIR